MTRRRWITGGVGALGAMVCVQTAIAAHGATTFVCGLEQNPALDLVIRVATTLLAALCGVLIARRLRVHERPAPAVPWFVLLSAGIAMTPRSGVQIVSCASRSSGLAGRITDRAAALALVAGAIAAAVVVARLHRGARESERRRLAEAADAAQAFAALQREELRTRQAIADELHGTVQNQLVLVEAELAAIAASGVPPTSEQRIAAVSARLEDIRERELRSLGVALYPEELDRGLVPALRALRARAPASISVDLRLEGGLPGGSTATRGGELPLERRLVVVRLVEEAITNAVRHGRAKRIVVRLAMTDGELVVAVDDDGAGLTPTVRMSGLARLGRRLSDLGGGLALEPGTARGASLSARLPLSTTGAATAPRQARTCSGG